MNGITTVIKDGIIYMLLDIKPSKKGYTGNTLDVLYSTNDYLAFRSFLQQKGISR